MRVLMWGRLQLAQREVTAALANLSLSDENKFEIAKGGAITPLIARAQSEDQNVARQACACLANLAEMPDNQVCAGILERICVCVCVCVLVCVCARAHAGARVRAWRLRPIPDTPPGPHRGRGRRPAAHRGHAVPLRGGTARGGARAWQPRRARVEPQVDRGRGRPPAHDLVRGAHIRTCICPCATPPPHVRHMRAPPCV